MTPPLPPPPIPKPGRQTSLLAIWSFVLGIGGFLLFVPAIAGMVLGIAALVRIKRSDGRLGGQGLAVAGLAVSLVWLFIGVLAALVTLTPRSRRSLAEQRHHFSTELVRKEQTGFPVPEPPADQLKIVHYRSPVGELAAYLSLIPDDGKKHPSIVWLTGGFSNSISETAWEPAKEENDQSARSFRDAGVVTLYPSLRGGNENPGFHEIAFGEVDDVLAATEFLAAQPGIDPGRIYLGGHSTGGTLALLVAESSPRFRAVFAFGPVARISDYGADVLTFRAGSVGENDLRSPVGWLAGISTPTFVFEGDSGRSNIDSLRTLMRASNNSRIHFHPIPGKSHFSVLAPYSRLIAKQIIADTGPSPNFHF